MKSALNISIRMGAGGLLALLLPRDGILEGSTRIIPFFALLMAGVLPAMMQTVTVLKGDDLSPKAVRDYSAALQEQLHFWAALFASALSAVGCLVLAVIIDKAPDLIWLPGRFWLNRDFVVDILIFLFGATGISVLSRFTVAYGGLKSLLRLNLQLAELKSQKSSKTILKALSTPEQTEGPRVHKL